MELSSEELSDIALLSSEMLQSFINDFLRTGCPVPIPKGDCSTQMLQLVLLALNFHRWLQTPVSSSYTSYTSYFSPALTHQSSRAEESQPKRYRPPVHMCSTYGFVLLELGISQVRISVIMLLIYNCMQTVVQLKPQEPIIVQLLIKHF